jgi:Galactose oxidase, central domain
MFTEEFLLSEREVPEKRKVKIIPSLNIGCPQIKNHSAILYKKCIYLFGGYDGKKNHNFLHMYDIIKNEWTVCITFGKEPEGRNGHTATLIGILIFKKINKKKIFFIVFLSLEKMKYQQKKIK